jgi:hypothetical protein
VGGQLFKVSPQWVVFADHDSHTAFRSCGRLYIQSRDGPNIYFCHARIVAETDTFTLRPPPRHKTFIHPPL